MYFAGPTKCFLCGRVEILPETEESGWRAIKAEKKVYFFCDECSPETSASLLMWTNFYVESVRRIYKKDFNRPIKKIMFMRDGGDHAVVINPNAQFN